jgi:hypothetical protein
MIVLVGWRGESNPMQLAGAGNDPASHVLLVLDRGALILLPCAATDRTAYLSSICWRRFCTRRQVRDHSFLVMWVRRSHMPSQFAMAAA